MVKHVYSTPYGGREIYRDGKPFALITSAIDVDREGPNWDPVALSEFGRMAAAASDMFEALHDLLTRPTDGAARVRARAALAKARGEG